MSHPINNPHVKGLLAYRINWIIIKYNLINNFLLQHLFLYIAIQQFFLKKYHLKKNTVHNKHFLPDFKIRKQRKLNHRQSKKTASKIVYESYYVYLKLYSLNITINSYFSELCDSKIIFNQELFGCRVGFSFASLNNMKIPHVIYILDPRSTLTSFITYPFVKYIRGIL